MNKRLVEKYGRQCPGSRLRAWAPLALLFLSALGCTRNFYRTQADQEISYTIHQLSSLSRNPLEYFNVYTDPRSRLFDPTNPDRPPMPPDDPEAHKLMHAVNYMNGYRKWYRNGTVPVVDLNCWQQYLPGANEEGAIPLDMGTAMELARLNSRDYQSQLETLYLAAMDVTSERFRFTTQWFNDPSATYNSLGPLAAGGPAATWTLSNDLQAQKLFGSGGQLLVEIANTLTWNLVGHSQTNNTIASFSLMQPILRNAGRAFVMERLTLVERTLLYSIRQMEQYRRAYFTFIASGRSPGSGPQRVGGVFGTAGLGGFTGVGTNGFGQVGTAVAATSNPALGGSTSGAGAAQANGFIGILQDIMQIRNQEANVAGLRDSLAQLQAAYEAGRIDRFQVDLTRQSLYLNESQVLNAKVVMENLLDSFKVSMGLPPDINFAIQDPFLDRFKLLDPGLTKIQNHVVNLVEKIRNPVAPLTAEDMTNYLADVDRLRAEIVGHLNVVDADFEKLDKTMPSRRATLERLQLRPEYDRGDVEPEAYNVKLLDERVSTLKDDYVDLKNRLGASWQEYDGLSNELRSAEPETSRRHFLDISTGLSAQVLELTLIQARSRLDAIELVPISLLPSQAVVIASANRPDWQNTRGSVIDTWRSIEFNANQLRSGLNVIFNGDIQTTDDNPVKFRGATGDLNVSLQFDTPLTRLNERNNYRQSLLTYQQARRRWMQFVDTIHQVLRQEIRQINLNQINFEQNRAAVGIAIEKVDIARLRLMQPPAPGETTTFSNTFARDLLQALNDLLQAQNDFMSIWVNYEVQRISLDFDLGIMELDERGMWIDPGPMDGAKLMEQYAQVCEPEELPFRRQSAEDAQRQRELLDKDTTEEEREAEELPPGEPHTTDAVDGDLEFAPEIPVDVHEADRLFAPPPLVVKSQTTRAEMTKPAPRRSLPAAPALTEAYAGKPVKIISPTKRVAETQKALKAPDTKIRRVAGEEPIE
ncbi:MAG TPA: TolC family protein [Pirellulales bacterium]